MLINRIFNVHAPICKPFKCFIGFSVKCGVCEVRMAR